MRSLISFRRPPQNQRSFDLMWTATLATVGVMAGIGLVCWGTRWGSTPGERGRAMPGDQYLECGPPARVAMTRAISIDAPPERVWPWIAQLGRGAGWYSIDWLDNGRKASARHIVSWIPEPQLGDAAAIGYLRYLDSGRALAWWADGARFVGAQVCLVTCFALSPEEGGTRLISRMSADAAGPTAHIALLVFRIIDSIMACRQLLNIRARIHVSIGPTAPRSSETGALDQYQLYETLYATKDSAGVAGTENGAKFRQSAIRDKVLRVSG